MIIYDLCGLPVATDASLEEITASMDLTIAASELLIADDPKWLPETEALLNGGLLAVTRGHPEASPGRAVIGALSVMTGVLGAKRTTRHLVAEPGYVMASKGLTAIAHHWMSVEGKIRYR